MVKIKKVNHGDIIAIPLYQDKYAVAKYLDLTQILDDPSYPDALKIFFGIYDLNEINVHTLKNNLLLPTLAVANVKKGIKDKFKIIGNEVINEEDMILPSVKSGHPPHLYGYDESKYEKWKILENLGDTSKYGIQDYNESIHKMEWAGAINFEVVTLRILIEYCKIIDRDPKEFSLIKDWLDEEIYNRSISLPIYCKGVDYSLESIKNIMNHMFPPLLG